MAIRAILTACLLAAMAAGPAHAATVVSLTFDDGEATQYAARAPLASHGAHATFYLNSAKLGTSGFYMTWAEAGDLAADGNEIGGHTLSHVDLTDAGLSDAEKRAEVCGDRENLIAAGFDPVSFAYPYGTSDAAAQAIVRDCGYASARRVGGIASPGWCPECGVRTEPFPAANAFDVRTASFGGGELTLAVMQAVIARAELSGGGWIPLAFHGVCESAACGEGAVRPSTISALLDWLAPRAAHGTVVRTVREAVESPAPVTVPARSEPRRKRCRAKRSSAAARARSCVRRRRSSRCRRASRGCRRSAPKGRTPRRDT
jgi:peptidoglycan/xylan/chitin deacetylase (PgdA/CDA1 family)